MEQTTLLLLLTLNCFSYGSQYYVKPTPDTECPQPCHTLSHYTSNLQDYFKPNTTFLFLPGVFTMVKTAALGIRNSRSIALIGSNRYTATDLSEEYQYPIPVSEIECVGYTGIVFCAGSNIAIKHIRMRNCYMGLVFIFTMNVKVQHILIENSTAIGIYGIQMLGNNSILDSAFVQNTKNARFKYLEHYYEAQVCPVPQSLSMVASRLEIEGSHFLQGHQNLQYDDAGGLTISIQRFPVDVFVQVADTTFSHNRGGNMAVYVHEQAAHNVFMIENCSFINGSAHKGGAIAVYIHGKLCDSVNHLQPHTFLQISSSRFHLNYVISYTSNKLKRKDKFCGCGGAMFIDLLKNCIPVEVHIRNCTFLRNVAENEGAGISINEITYSHVVNTISIVNNTVFEGGSSGTVGGGISFNSTVVTVPAQIGTLPTEQGLPIKFQLSHTSFSENTAGVYAGALFLTFQALTLNSDRIVGRIEITNCDISNNVGFRGATGVLIRSTHSPSSHKIVLANVSTCCHRGVHLENKTAVTSVIVVRNINTIQFINCNFYNNNQTALMALTSQLTFLGNMSFVNNQGSLGGALALHESVMNLCNNTELVIKDNKALWQGGGIYVAQQIPFAVPYPCFFQISTADYIYISQFSTRIIMENNTAPTGSAIYGGSVDFCTSKSVLFDDQKGTYAQGKQIFDTIFQIKPSKANDPSVISSVASDVCFCESGLVQCDVRTKNATIYPGGILNTSVVTVGQRNGTSPGDYVVSSSYRSLLVFKTNPPVPFLELLIFQTQCTELKYHIFSQERTVTIQYQISTPSFNQGILLLVSLLECPPGFILTPNGSCDCVPVLKQHGITCTIDNQTVHRYSPLWIGYRPPAELDAHSNLTAQEYSNSSEQGGTMVHKHCPLDYCKAEDVYMWLNDTDEQCANNHSGVLCGACKPGFSVVFGSSRCLTCTSSYLALVLVFGVAGVALVALLTLCGLTVSEGTLNGLVFYANVVQANSSSFFLNRTNHALIIFIAWVNLDLGIETCFYDGMDMYAKAWLQFVFPLYIWLLVIAITVSSNYSITAAKLAGRNAPKVLSTLFLLSDARILRAVITAFSFTSVSQPNGQNAKLVWLLDGNVHYFSGKHIALLIAGLLFTMLFLTPYTLIVCFIQHLQHHSNFRLLRWVQRLKPLLDAYTGPYKDRYRFWTGLLLLVRIILFLAFAFNTLGDPSLNILFINVTANCLLAIKWMLGGIYKKWTLDILEASSFLNLSVLSAATLYAKLAGGEQVAITSTSTAVAFATFVGIVIYHMYKSIKRSVYLRRLKTCFKNFFKDQNTISCELEPLATGTRSGSNDSDSEDLRMEPHARVQPLRLTFDSDNEPVLVAISDNCIRVQKQVVDQDEECTFVVSDTTRE